MATNDAAEDQLDLKKRARRRLVGAAALALLAIIVLPIVMDHEPKPAAQDIQVRIPSQDGEGLAAKVISGKPKATPLPPVAESAPETPPAPAPVASAAPAAKPEAAAEPKAETKPATKAEAEKPVPKPEVKGADKSKAEKPAEKAVDKTPKKAEEARATAALEGKSAAASGGQWVVQLGAYQNQGNVKLLLSKLKEIGVPAYTEKLDAPDGAKTRVRAGPFPSKEAAEKAQARIKIIGVGGPVAPK